MRVGLVCTGTVTRLAAAGNERIIDGRPVDAFASVGRYRICCFYCSCQIGFYPRAKTNGLRKWFVGLSFTTREA